MELLLVQIYLRAQKKVCNSQERANNKGASSSKDGGASSSKHGGEFQLKI